MDNVFHSYSPKVLFQGPLLPQRLKYVEGAAVTKHSSLHPTALFNIPIKALNKTKFL